MRYQRGYLFKRSGSWWVRYSKGGKQPTERLGLADEITKGEARRRATDVLRTVNEPQSEDTMTVEQFVEAEYLPYVLSTKRASTIHEYTGLWPRYLKSKAQIGLRDFRTSDGERILAAIARDSNLSVTTLKHIKAFLSGVFRYALRVGRLDGANPVSAVAIPHGKPPRETMAYGLAEIQQMLKVLPEPSATIVALAAFTALRKGEIRGLRWEDYDGRDLKVTRACWRDTVAEPKTRKSKAPVPVIPQLAERLNALRVNGAGTGPMFAGQRADGTIDLDVVARAMYPKLKAAGIPWYGWHGFRRGLATVLHELEVPDVVIQLILRHSNVSVTQACYIKRTGAAAQEAMGRLSQKMTAQNCT